MGEKLNFIPNTETAEDLDKSEKTTQGAPYNGVFVEEENNREDDRPILGITKDGAVVRDRRNSHFHSEGGLTLEKLDSAINQMSVNERGFVVAVVKFDENVGETTCVNIGPDDDVVMVYRKGREGQTPMVKNRSGEPCNEITVILAKDRELPKGKNCILITSYIGGGSKKEPWDRNIRSEEERRECEEFWAKHALLYDENLIDWERTSKETIA